MTWWCGQEYLKACRSSEGVFSIPGGREFYQECLRFHTSLDISPQQVHDLGLAEVERIRKKMNMVRFYWRKLLDPVLASTEVIKVVYYAFKWKLLYWRYSINSWNVLLHFPPSFILDVFFVLHSYFQVPEEPFGYYWSYYSQIELKSSLVTFE